ncbi:MAG: hypothetical protein E7056_00855 [Lentisphaerae bacterium]|nr:hypothetical protein [Lentisphaerota bacterium]
MRFFSWAFFLLGATAFSLSAGTFTVEGEKNDLVIKYDNEIMVRAIELNMPAAPDKFDYKVLPDGSRVWNAWNENPEYKFRREVALRPDNTVEINLACYVPVFNENRVRTMSFKMPYSFFAGGKYRALHTNSRSWNYQEGDFAADSKNFPKQPWRFMTLEKGEKKIIFDMNALGAADFCHMYTGGAVRGVWQVMRKGDDLEIFSGATVPVAHDYTGLKMVLREGVFEDYDKLHAQRAFTYTNSFKPLALYSFGDNRVGGMYTPNNLRSYSVRNRAGWVGFPELKTYTASKEGAYYSHMAGKDAVFRRSNLASGFYIVTVGAGNGSGTANNFSLSVNGEDLEKNISVKKDTVHVASKTFHVGKDGVLDIKFDGDFIVSAIGIQFLMADAEDYTLYRGFWKVDGFEPGSIYRNIDYAKKPVFKLASDTFVLPVSGKEAAGPLKKIQSQVLLPDPDSPELAWLPTGNWFKMLSNSSTLSEADTPEKADRLIKSKIAGKNYDAVMVSGMHSRHTYINHVQRGIEAFRVMAESAHKHNLKLIDHHDATLCWNVDAGLRFMAENLPEAVRNCDTLLPSYQLCPSDPDFCERYYKYLTELVKAGVDGFQIDELVYEMNTCSCQHCREKFYEATGCYYPVNELDKDVQNAYSELRRQWFQWRKASIADWFVELRRRCMPYNKNLVLCMYTTHWGFTRSNPRYSANSCLFELGRAVNYFGTEVMSRNPLMTYRNLLPHRRMKNVLTLTYGTPIWAWIYASRHPQIYAGWAISNMAKQVALLPEIVIKPNEADFLKFDTSKENMPRTGVEAHTKVALLFSQASRDWNTNISFSAELFGLAQSLDAEHISYEFICDNQLNSKDLAKYNVIFLAGNNCIADESAAVIKEFIRNGGTAVITPYTGINDEMGRARKEWIFKEIFDFTPQFRNVSVKSMANNALAEIFKMPVMPAEHNAEVLASGTLANGSTTPLALAKSFGKGKVIYLGGVFGSMLCEGEGSHRHASRSKAFDPAIDSFYRQLIVKAAANGRVWSTNAPEKVITALWRNKDKIYVHFFNATGVEVKAGEMLDPLAPRGEKYPALTADISFTLKAVKNGKVTAYSPDFEGGKVLESTYRNGELTVTLPKALLKTYTLIHVEQ